MRVSKGTRARMTKVRQPGSRQPFRRINLLVAALNAAAATKEVAQTIETQAAYDAALSNLMAYESRGHGWGLKFQRTVGGRWMQNRSKYPRKWVTSIPLAPRAVT